MPSLNKCTIIGHLGRDPEIRYTQDGKPVANFSVACSDKYADKEHTEWFNIVAWNKLAEIAQKYLTKGKLVYIEGRIQTREWEDKEGNKRKNVELIANQLLMLSGKDKPAEPEFDGSETPF